MELNLSQGDKILSHNIFVRPHACNMVGLFLSVLMKVLEHETALFFFLSTFMLVTNFLGRQMKIYSPSNYTYDSLC